MTITLRLNRRFMFVTLFACAMVLLFAAQSSVKSVTAAPTPCPPLAEPRITQAAVEFFEHGWILWMGDTRQLYVLTMTQGKMQGTVAVYPENWENGMPETDGAFVAPPGLRQPTRGIGKLWRENPSVRGSVGWAIKDAEGLMMVITQQGDTLWLNGDHNAFKITGGQWQEFYGWPRPGF